MTDSMRRWRLAGVCRCCWRCLEQLEHDAVAGTDSGCCQLPIDAQSASLSLADGVRGDSKLQLRKTCAMPDPVSSWLRGGAPGSGGVGGEGP